MKPVNQQKKELRELVLEQRRQMDEERWLAHSNTIVAKLQQQNWFQKAGVVHCYVSMNERNEVCTDDLIQNMLDTGKRVVVPVTNFSEISLKHIEIDSLEDLKQNKWGIREPVRTKEVPAKDLDVIVIPMAAADYKRNRLGYGKGFYDRFLEQTQAVKVGLVFSDFLYDEIPVDEHDVTLDIIITENEIINP